jgi:hypothetical protein
VANKVNEYAAQVIGMSPEKGALPFLMAATDPSVVGGSFYGPHLLSWGHPAKETPSKQARDVDAAGALWALSEELTGLRPFA